MRKSFIIVLSESKHCVGEPGLRDVFRGRHAVSSVESRMQIGMQRMHGSGKTPGSALSKRLQVMVTLDDSKMGTDDGKELLWW